MSSDEQYTIFCRNLSENVTETILYELFLQAGPVEDVRIPTQDGRNRNYGFVVYKHKSSVRYAIDLLRDTKLYGKAITLHNRVLVAEKQAEMRSRTMAHMRDNEVNALRGGSLSNLFRVDSADVGPHSYSKNKEISSLRGASIGFCRMDNMAPRGYVDSLSNPKSDSNLHLKYANPYASSFKSTYQSPSQLDSRDYPSSYDWNRRGRSPPDRRKKNDSRRNHDYSRKNHSSKSGKDYEKRHARHSRGRSGSRDRSPISHKTSKYRHR